MKRTIILNQDDIIQMIANELGRKCLIGDEWVDVKLSATFTDDFTSLEVTAEVTY